MNPGNMSMEPLTVPGTLDSLDAVGKYVRDVSAAAGLGKESAYKLRLAVDELATNIVMHGYEANGIAGDITITAESTDAGLVVTLEDSGPAYDPRTARMPDEADLSRPLGERKLGGLGIFLTSKSVDGFDYRRDGDRNRCILLMRRGPTQRKESEA